MTKRHFGRSASRKHIALITWSGLPQGAESEQLLLPHLAAGGVDAELVNWSDTTCDFAQFDLVVLRTCWDYHLRVAEFIDWLRQTARLVPVLNAPETVLWNHNKFYLQELEAQGIQIAPTVFVTGGGSIGSASVGSEDRAQILSWEKMVVKPAIKVVQAFPAAAKAAWAGVSSLSSARPLGPKCQVMWSCTSIHPGSTVNRRKS